MTIPRLWSKPSQIRKYIVGLFPSGLPAPRTPGRVFGADADGIGGIEGLVALLDALDPAILIEGLSSDEDRQRWIVATSCVRGTLESWKHVANHSSPLKLRDFPDGQGHHHHVLLAIYDILGKCKDEPTPLSLKRLTFLPPDMAENVARDIDSLHPLLRQEQWKAAAVIGGSIVEAILLNRVEHKIGDQRAIDAYAVARGWVDQKGRPSPSSKWGLERIMQACEGRPADPR